MKIAALGENRAFKLIKGTMHQFIVRFPPLADLVYERITVCDLTKNNTRPNISTKYPATLFNVKRNLEV